MTLFKKISGRELFTTENTEITEKNVDIVCRQDDFVIPRLTGNREKFLGLWVPASAEMT
jgi:hypothetical protein